MFHFISQRDGKRKRSERQVVKGACGCTLIFSTGAFFRNVLRVSRPLTYEASGGSKEDRNLETRRHLDAGRLGTMIAGREFLGVDADSPNASSTCPDRPDRSSRGRASDRSGQLLQRHAEHPAAAADQFRYCLLWI